MKKKSKEQWLSPQQGEWQVLLQNPLMRKMCRQARRLKLQYVTWNLRTNISLVKSERGRGIRLGIKAQQHSSQARGSLNLGHSDWGEWPYTCLKTKPQGARLWFFVYLHSQSILIWLALNCLILWVKLNFNILHNSWIISEERGGHEAELN